MTLMLDVEEIKEIVIGIVIKLKTNVNPLSYDESGKQSDQKVKQRSMYREEKWSPLKRE